MNTIKYIDKDLNERVVKIFDDPILAHVCANALQKHARSFYGNNVGYHMVVKEGKSVIYV